MPLPQSQTEDIKKVFVEKAMAYAAFIRKNRIYAFRDPTDTERAMEQVLGEKLFMPPNPKQALLLAAWNDPIKKVFTFTGGNRLGKTVIGSGIISISTIFGKWPWSQVPIHFMHKKPRKVRIVGQAWETHVKTVIIPALKFWWPSNRPYETKKNNQGIEAVWKDLLTGGTIEVMSNVQDSDVFEGWEGDLIIYDEPPRREVRIACARGLIDRQGKELFCATLLKEAWVHREVIKARLKDGKPDMSVFNVTGEIYDNLGYGLTQAGIDQFAKTLKPDEAQARLMGKPSYMSSLVFPRINRELHVKEAGKVPLDAIVDFNIDFHPSKPWAVQFLATYRNGFKYVVKEIRTHGNPKMIAEEIIRYIETNHLRFGRGQIDPLAKGDENNDNTVYEVMSQVLGSHNILLEVASKDKDNGIAMVNDLLWTENQMPGLFFWDSCPISFQQTEDLMYDPEDINLKAKAMKIDDDFTECLYRNVLMNTVWYPPQIYDISSQQPMMV